MNVWRHLWRNGGRPLILATVYTLMAFATLVIVFLAVKFWPEEEPFGPITVSDVEILSRVEGVDGPATHAGGHYNGTITICNNNTDTHTLTFIIQFERLGGPVRLVSGGSVEFPKEPGCDTITGDSAPLPEEVTPGLWRESSSAVVQQGKAKQTVSFVSEPFEVIP